MTPRHLLLFAWLRLVRAPAGTLWCIWGQASACAALLAILAVADGALLRARLFVGPQAGAGRLKVVADPPSLSDWAFGALGGGLGPAALDERALHALQQVPGVAAAHPVRTLPLAVAARGGAALLGHDVEVDVLLEALPSALAPPGAFDDAGAVTPVLVHPQLLALYNAGVAPNLGTPQLPPEALVGTRARLLFGRGRLAGRQPCRAFEADIAVVGSSGLAAPLGLSVPAPVALTWWQRSGASQPLPPLRAVWLELAHAEARAGASAAVARLGLSIDESAEQASRALRVGERAARGLALLIFGWVGLSSLQLQLAQAAAHAQQWPLLRALGASRLGLLALSAASALAASAASLLLGWALCSGLCRLLMNGCSYVCRPLGFDVMGLGPPLAPAPGHLAWAAAATAASAALSSAWAALRALRRRQPAS